MSNGFDFMKEYMEKENEERIIREQEAQIRYADRRAEKMELRRRIEEAAGRICDMVNIERVVKSWSRSILSKRT